MEIWAIQCLYCYLTRPRIFTQPTKQRASWACLPQSLANNSVALLSLSKLMPLSIIPGGSYVSLITYLAKYFSRIYKQFLGDSVGTSQQYTHNIWVVPVSWHCGHWSPWRFSAPRLFKDRSTCLDTWRHFDSHLKDIFQFRLVGSPWNVNHCQVVHTLICVWGHVWAKRPSWNLFPGSLTSIDTLTHLQLHYYCNRCVRICISDSRIVLQKQYVHSVINMVRYNPPNGKHVSSQCIQAEKNKPMR